MLTVTQLVHLRALDDHRSFARAAKSVHVTQPALSRSIQALERGLGVRLFDRGRGGVEPTVFGELAGDRARAILDAISDLERQVRLVQGLDTGTLDLRLAPYPMVLSGQRAVARLLSEHPKLQCRLKVVHFTEIAEDAASGRCDLAIGDTGIAEEQGLSADVVATRPIRFLCRPNHPLRSRRTCTIQELVDFPWATIRAPSRIARYLPDDLGRAGRWDPRTGEFVPALEVDVMANFSVLAKESDILVAATLTMVADELANGELAIMPFEAPWLRLNYGFITRPGLTVPPAANRFMAIVREIEAEIDRTEHELVQEFL